MKDLGTFGKSVAEIRTHWGLTQKELAKLAGVSTSLIISIESGRRNPSEDSHRKILDAINKIMKEPGHKPGYAALGYKNEKDMLRAELALANGGIRRWQRTAEMLGAELDKAHAQIDELKDILGLREKKILTEESEQEKIDALGLEKIPPVEEEELRAEITQRGKKGSK